MLTVFNSPRRTMLSLALFTALTSLSAQCNAAAPSAAAPETVFVDPMGLELNGTEAVASDISFENRDVALLAIWIAAAIALCGMEMAKPLRFGSSQMTSSPESHEPRRI